MLPVQRPTNTYRTLDEIRQRKDELYDYLVKDNEQFTNLWRQLFVSRKSGTKAEFVSGLIANSITAVDAFLMVRKLMKNYGSLFGRRKKR